MHRGASVKYPLAEAAVKKLFLKQRKSGRRVTERWLVVTMRKQVRAIYGDAAAESFKGSHGWLINFSSRECITLRRGSNNKPMCTSDRIPKIKRWHARLRRRLKRGMDLDPKWGKWLPENRLSIDQVIFHSAPLFTCFDLLFACVVCRYRAT